MSKPESEPSSPGGELLEDGWAEAADDAGEGSAASPTTADPKLLDRLIALDGKAEGGAAPLERRDKTVTLDISDLELMAEEDDESEIEVSQEALVSEDVESSTPSMDAPAPAASKPPEAPIPAAMARKPPADRSQINAPQAGEAAAAAPVVTNDAPAPEGPSVEIDEEFAEEKTQIFVTAMDDEPTRAKLKVVQGGGQQKEYLLARDRVTIGRGTNNDILVPDIAISRQHCEIKRMPDGTFRMADLQSGNGTKLNGARVLDSDLFGGDRIEVGSTILEFVVTGPGASRPAGDRKINYHPSESQAAVPARSAPAPARSVPPPVAVPNYSSNAGAGNATMTHFQVQAVQPAPAGSNTLITVLIAGLGVIFLTLAGLIGATIYFDSQKKPDERVVNKPASDYYFEGSSHVKERDWDKAEEKFTIAADLAVEERDFDIRKNANLQLERVRKEKNNQKALQRGQVLVSRGDNLEAIARLESVRSGSVYYQEARDLIPTARDKHIAGLVKEAQKDFDAKNYDEADKKLAQALSVKEDAPAALALQKKIEELPTDTYERPETPRVVANNNGGGNGKTSKPDKNNGKAVAVVTTPPTKVEKDTGKTPPAKVETGGKGDVGKTNGSSASSGVANFAPGYSMYRRKSFGEAAAYFDNIAKNHEGFTADKAKKLASQIKSFQSNYTKGKQAYTNRAWSGASSTLNNASRLDRKIVKGGYHQSELNKMLSESYYQLGLTAFNSNQTGRAGAYAKKALVYNAAHPGNRQLLGQLETRGKSMYIDAFNKKKTDPKQAKRLAESIVSMLPSSSGTHQKAKQLLKEL